MKKKRTRTLQSPKYLEKKRKKKILNSSLIVISILGFGAFLIFLLRIGPLQISNINIIGVKTLDEKELSDTALKALEGKYFGIIPKTSVIFYSKSNIVEVLKGNYKKIQTVDIITKDLTNLDITITESVPTAIVCDGFREEETHDKCFFVDKKAYIFEPATGISDGVYVKYYVSHGDSSIAPGNTFMDEKRFTELDRFMTTIKNDGVYVAGILVSDAGSYELYVKNKDSSITVVYFDDRTPFEKTSSNFLAFWQSAMDNKLGASTTPVFDYINLRFGNNVFYTTR